MRHWRLLTVTATTGFCLFGMGLPAAQAADSAPTSSALMRAAKASPWKSTLTRGIRRTTVAPALTVATGPAPAPVVTVTDPSVAFAQRVAELVNVERAKAGLPGLQVSTCAQSFAVSWSRTMAATGDFSHQSLLPVMTGCGARGAGENIAYGAASAEEFMTMWMNSAGHRANILRATFTHIGVGMARSDSGRWYGTQDFLTL